MASLLLVALCILQLLSHRPVDPCIRHQVVDVSTAHMGARDVRVHRVVPLDPPGLPFDPVQIVDPKLLAPLRVLVPQFGAAIAQIRVVLLALGSGS